MAEITQFKVVIQYRSPRSNTPQLSWFHKVANAKPEGPEGPFMRDSASRAYSFDVQAGSVLHYVGLFSLSSFLVDLNHSSTLSGRERAMASRTRRRGLAVLTVGYIRAPSQGRVRLWSGGDDGRASEGTKKVHSRTKGFSWL